MILLESPIEKNHLPFLLFSYQLWLHFLNYHPVEGSIGNHFSITSFASL